MINDLFNLSEEIALVIGGTGTLGGAMAQALGGYGATVVVGGRNADRGEACCESIRQAGGRATFVAVDALDQQSLVQAQAHIKDQLGVVSVLVNAAGGNRAEAILSPGDEFADLPLEAWQSVFELNLVGGALLPCQTFGPEMLAAGRGSIINIASLSGMIPLSRVVSYSAAKAAVINLTQFLAREWATRGVRVNAISPGFFPAEQNMSLLLNEDGSYTERGQQIINHTPMQRYGKPDELDGAVVWLASQQASSFVTGQNIVVDGGFSSATI